MLNSEIFSLKTEKDSLQEELDKVSNQLAEAAEEKAKFEKLSEKLEIEKSEVEDKSKQQENKIEELIKLQEVGCTYFIVVGHDHFFHVVVKAFLWDLPLLSETVLGRLWALRKLSLNRIA